MDNKPVDTGVGMQAEKIDMDKYNLEHMVKKWVAEHEVECKHVQREEEIVQKSQPVDVQQEGERRVQNELELVDHLRNACSPLAR
jgi:hypothetical protein